MAIELGDGLIRIKGDLSELGPSIEKSKAQVASISDAFKKHGLVAATALTTAGAAITAGIGDAVSKTADFEQAITNAASVTGKSGNEFVVARDKMAELARTLGRETVFSATEAANAFYDLSSKGFDVASMSVEQLKPMLDLAAATQSDLAGATEVTTATLRGFGMENSETTRISDVFTKAIGSSAAKMDLLGTSMPIVATTAKTVGVSLEETTAALSKLYDNGVDASTAATGLRNVMMDLTDKTGPVAEKIEDLGIDISEVDLSSMGLSGAFEYLASKGMTAEQALAIFGKRNGMVAATMIESYGAVRGLTKELENAGGTADKVSKQQLDTLHGKTKLLKSALEDIGLSIGNAVVPALTSLVKAITPVVQAIADFLAAHPAITAALTGIVGALGLVSASALPLWGVVKAFTAIKAIVLAVHGSMGALTTAGELAQGSIGALTSASWLLVPALVAIDAVLWTKVIKAFKAWRESVDEMHKSEERLAAKHEEFRARTGKTEEQWNRESNRIADEHIARIKRELEAELNRAATTEEVIARMRQETDAGTDDMAGAWNDLAGSTQRSTADIAASEQRISPYARHSPSLVEQTQRGLEVIAAAWDSFATYLRGKLDGLIERIKSLSPWARHSPSLVEHTTTGLAAIMNKWTTFSATLTNLWAITKSKQRDFINEMTKQTATGTDAMTNRWKEYRDTVRDIMSGLQKRLRDMAEKRQSLVRAHAVGGTIRSPLAIVGERGPELVAGAQGARVYSNATTMRMLGQTATAGAGSGVTINIDSMNVRDDQDVSKIAEKLYNIINRRLRQRGM